MPAVRAVGWRRAALVCSFACCLHATRARADEPARTQAQVLFESGLALSSHAKWREAREAFLESARLTPRASTFYNLAISSLELGFAREALLALERFDALAQTGVPAAHAQLAAALRARALMRVGTLQLSLAPAAAQVEIDGAPEPSPAAPSGERSIWLDPGPHVVRVSANGMQTQSLEVSVTPQTTLYRKLELQPLAPVAAAEPVAPAPVPAIQLPVAASPAASARVAPASPSSPPPRADDGSLWSEPVTWIVIGVVVAGGVTGGVLLATRDDERSMAYGGSTGVVF